MSVVLLCHLSENMWGLENPRVGRLWGSASGLGHWSYLLDVLPGPAPCSLQGCTSAVGTETQARGIFSKLWVLGATSHLSSFSGVTIWALCGFAEVSLVLLRSGLRVYESMQRWHPEAPLQ